MISSINHGAIKIKSIQFKGRITRTEGDEYAEITNSGDSPVDVSGYKLTAGNRQSFVFPAKSVLGPGKSVRVYTNLHDAETGGLSFNSKTAIWNNKGDEGVLFDASGKDISRYAYGSRAKKKDDGAPAPTAGPAPVPGAAINASAKGEEGLSAEAIWSQVKAAWPGFDFMWQPGDTEEDIAAAEARLGIKVPENVRQVLKVCSGAGAGFPTPFGSSIAAEVCLRSVKLWRDLASLDATEEDFESWEADGVFEGGHVKDVVAIGENCNAADYGLYVLLDTSTGKIYRLLMTDGTPEAEGTFEEWLLKRSAFPGLAKQSQGYVGTYGFDSDAASDIMAEEDFAGAKSTAKHHRQYLGYSAHHKDLLKAWSKVEAQFVETVDRLNKK
jgi:Lamin Tail Domain/SMI1 / KNR4 family (SUKH-1)